MTAAVRIAIGLVLMSILASLVIYSGVDRIAAKGIATDGPAIVPMGPQRFRNAGARALAEGDFTAAMHYARMAIARDPANAASTSLLGAVQLKAGDPAASLSYLAAGRFGWRDPSTQLYLITQADKAANVQVMTERTDALLRVGAPIAALAPIIRRIEALPGGSSALATRLSLTPAWSGGFLTEAAAEPDIYLTRRIATLREARKRGLVVDCGKVDDAVGLLLKQNRPTVAYAFWQQLECGGDGATNLGTVAGNFAEVKQIDSSRAAHFGWSIMLDANLDVKFDQTNDGSALYVSSSAPVSTQFAKRMVLFPPGRYMMRWTVRRPPSASGLAVDIDVICLNNGIAVAGPMLAAAQDGSSSVELTVPVNRCAAQQLRFVALPTEGSQRQVWISDITVTPISQPNIR